MKKSLFVAAFALLFAASVSAQGEYTHSIGGTVGTMYGVSYKALLSNIAIEVDLGVNLLGSVPYTMVTKWDGGSSKVKSSDFPSGWYDTFYYTFEANPNVMYQGLAKSWGWGSISWYAGGGLSLGLITYIDVVKKVADKYDIEDYYFVRANAKAAVDDYPDWWTAEDYAAAGVDYAGNSDSKVNFKWGLNAIGGAEIHFHKVPLAISLDFRPGYGMAVPKQQKNVTTLMHFFDYKVVTGVRYTF